MVFNFLGKEVCMVILEKDVYYCDEEKVDMCVSLFITITDDGETQGYHCDLIVRTDAAIPKQMNKDNAYFCGLSLNDDLYLKNEITNHIKGKYRPEMPFKKGFGLDCANFYYLIWALEKSNCSECKKNDYCLSLEESDEAYCINCFESYPKCSFCESRFHDFDKFYGSGGLYSIVDEEHTYICEKCLQNEEYFVCERGDHSEGDIFSKSSDLKLEDEYGEDYYICNSCNEMRDETLDFPAPEDEEDYYEDLYESSKDN